MICFDLCLGRLGALGAQRRRLVIPRLQVRVQLVHAAKDNDQIFQGSLFAADTEENNKTNKKMMRQICYKVNELPLLLTLRNVQS